MAFYLVRHGETDWNREKRFQSRTDVPLNQTGLAQAAALRSQLHARGIEFAAARCSPLGRARRTAEIILEGSAVELVVEPLFIELDFGGFEGRLESDLRDEYGEQYMKWRENQYTLSGPAGGENIVTGADRVKPALDLLAGTAQTGNVLIVAHQAVNMAMKVALSGKTDIESAATFRQANDEVDVWDAAGCRIEQFKIEPA